MTLAVPNAAAFIADPVAKQGIAYSLAETLGVKASEVAVTLAIETRRLGRNLAKGDVIVSYEVVVQVATTAAATAFFDKVKADLNTITPAALSTKIADEIKAIDSSKTYTVTVTSKPAPTKTVTEKTVVVPAATTTTTSTTAAATTTKQASESGASSQTVTFAFVLAALSMSIFA
eukprot:TRINITY_DN362_c0_g1_i8.p1 TRINITY_DN362_c0_g1~~TRINITY_DN362_c0_g1_i8.p1  ORF type:complete len:186 (-),score=64.84 TRINITY_DN362_c0_g1_i8:499-1023(-)